MELNLFLGVQERWLLVVKVRYAQGQKKIYSQSKSVLTCRLPDNLDRKDGLSEVNLGRGSDRAVIIKKII